MMAPRVRQIEGASPCILGEGAFWDRKEQSLWWVDIRGSALFRYAPQSEKLERWDTPEWITRVLPTGEPGALIGTLATALCRIGITGEDLAFQRIHTLDEPGMRFNDGALDPDGYFWAGTMRIEEDAAVGGWLRIDSEGKSVRLDTPGFTVTNGPAFDAARGHVYLTDSAAQCIYRARYDAEGGVADLKPWRRFSQGDGYPDGMVIGPDGLLWVAFWDGACVRALDASGAVAHEVALPVRRPTSIAFCSETTLYVTSAGFGLEADGVQGATLQVNLHG